MIFCKKCANRVGPATLRCSRCAWALPYWRSRRPRSRRALPGVAAGKDCPRCGVRTTREQTPLLLRPLRTLLPNRASYRSCGMCAWRGLAFHAPTSARAPRRAPLPAEAMFREEHARTTPAD